MANCSICKIKLGSFLAKLDDGSIICKSCYSKSGLERVEIKNNNKIKENDRNSKKGQENKKIMLDYISKYLQNKDDFTQIILGLHESDYIRVLLESDSLIKLGNWIQEKLNDVKSTKKSGLSSYEIDELIEFKKSYENTLYFLNDLEKLYKLFKKKEIDTDYFEILSLFSEIIEKNIETKYDVIVILFFKRISNRLGTNITKEGVVREFFKSPLDISRETIFLLIPKLFDKFNLKYENSEIEDLFGKVAEEIDLEDFEQDLGSSKTIEINDFTELNGYEFEGYLKDLFEYLGYTVLATPLSGDQGADLIISKDNEKTVVQAKKYNSAVTNKAIQEIVAAKYHYKSSKAIVVTNSTFTESAIELALSNNVELWDGRKLTDVINSIKTKNKVPFKSEGVIHCNEGEDVHKVEIRCPFCEGGFTHNINSKDLVADFVFEISCPLCGFGTINFSISSESLKCKFCPEKFNTMANKLKHQETCTHRVDNASS